jgi:hypothetical protein
MNTTKHLVDMVMKVLSRIKFEACRSRFNLNNVKSKN